MNNMQCLINKPACGRVPGYPVCPKCGLDERVMYPGTSDLDLAQMEALRRYEEFQPNAAVNDEGVARPQATLRSLGGALKSNTKALNKLPHSGVRILLIACASAIGLLMALGFLNGLSLVSTKFSTYLGLLIFVLPLGLIGVVKASERGVAGMGRFWYWMALPMMALALLGLLDI